MLTKNVIYTIQLYQFQVSQNDGEVLCAEADMEIKRYNPVSKKNELYKIEKNTLTFFYKEGYLKKTILADNTAIPIQNGRFVNAIGKTEWVHFHKDGSIRRFCLAEQIEYKGIIIDPGFVDLAKDGRIKFANVNNQRTFLLDKVKAKSS